MYIFSKNIFAFSLVELSIVLVILGLLTGGILSGQSLIKSAEYRAQHQQLVEYQTAAQIFREKYFALPGDMPNATDFWGIAGGTTGRDNNCWSVESYTKATCNGNNDGYISEDDVAGGNYWRYEQYHFWKHLANAGLIAGSYTGRTDSTTSDLAATPGKNGPAGKIPGSNVFVNNTEPIHGWSFPDHPIRSMFLLRGVQISVEDMFLYDKKYDDGKPGTGRIWVYRRDPPDVDLQNCVTNNDMYTAEYDLTTQGEPCLLQQTLH